MPKTKRIGRPPVPASDRFWEKVIIGEPPLHCPELGPCWIWIGAGLPNGYGVFTVRAGYVIGAHRFSYLDCVEDPGERNVLHRCDVKRCVRPDHLFLGNALINAVDRNMKQRQAFGERQGLTTLSSNDVAVIRESPLPRAELASLYSVHLRTIYKIRSGESWKYAP